MNNPFDGAAARYDEWFDSPEGEFIFRAESECLEPFIAGAPRPRLEIGVGTGRFARALGVGKGIDPSISMLKKAFARGVKVQRGLAESLPYKDHSFGGVLLVVTLCFLSEPEKALAEAARVLRKGGRLVVGFIPAGSPRGRDYARKGKEGHQIYTFAKFYAPEEVVGLARWAGLQLIGGRSLFLTSPVILDEPNRSLRGVFPDADFVALAFERHVRTRGTLHAS